MHGGNPQVHTRQLPACMHSESGIRADRNTPPSWNRLYSTVDTKVCKFLFLAIGRTNSRVLITTFIANGEPLLCCNSTKCAPQPLASCYVYISVPGHSADLLCFLALFSLTWIPVSDIRVHVEPIVQGDELKEGEAGPRQVAKPVRVHLPIQAPTYDGKDICAVKDITNTFFLST